MNFYRVTQKNISFLNTKNHLSLQRLNFYTPLATQTIDFVEKYESTKKFDFNEKYVSAKKNDFNKKYVSNDTYYSELKHYMQIYAKSGNVTKAFETLNLMKKVPEKPTINDFNALVCSLFKSKNVGFKDLVDVDFSTMKFGLYPNAITYNVLLNGLLARKIYDHLVHVVEKMLNSGFKPSFTIMSTILKKLLQCGKLYDTFSVFELMLGLGYVPNSTSLNMLIVCFSKAGMFFKAYSVFVVLLDRGLYRGAFSFNPILWGLCKCGQSYTALRLVYSLRKRGIVQDVCSYSALIYGFSRERLELEIGNCLKEMDKEGCKPNVKTYTNVLKFYCDDGNMKGAFDVLCTLEKLCLEPDIVTYNVILRQLSQQGNIDIIIEIMRIIEQKGLLGDLFTHAAIAGGLLKGGRRKWAYEFFLDVILNECKLDAANCNVYLNIRCQERVLTDVLSPLKSVIGGDEPSTVSCNTALKSLCDSHIREAMELFDCNGTEPNAISWNTFLKSLSANDIDMALELVKRIDWGQKGPDIISFNTILSAARKQRNTPMIRKLLNRMKDEGLTYNVVTLTCLIQHSCEIGKISEGLALLKDMISNGPSPTLVTFNTVINGLCKSGLVNLAYGFFISMRSNGFRPDLITYNTLLKTSTTKGNYQLRNNLLREIQREGLKPDSSTYSISVYRLFKEERISEACKLLLRRKAEIEISPGIGVYNLALYQMLKRGDSYVERLVKEMVIEGCEPNSKTYEVINRAVAVGWITHTKRKHLVSVLSSIEK